MKGFLATHNVVAISASAVEDKINQPLAPDLALLVAMDNIINPDHRTETNADDATGKEEPDTIYRRGGPATWNPTFNRAQPQHLAFLAGYGLGTATTVAAGSGYRHTFKPIVGDLDEERSDPSFTAVQRLGLSVVKELFASMFVDQFTLTATKDTFLKISGQCKATGFHQANVIVEEISGFADDVSLSPAANAVEGSTAAERLDSIHSIDFRQTGTNHWQPSKVTAVSDATPAVLTIKPVSASNDAGTWRVVYVPVETASLDTGTATSDPPDDESGVLTDSAVTMTEDEHEDRWLVMTSGSADKRIWKITENGTDTITCGGINLYEAGVRSGDAYNVIQFGWLPFPVRVNEPPLLVSGLYLYDGGYWNGSEFLGGRLIAAPLSELTYTFQKNLTPEFTAGSGTDAYATRALRSGRTQTLTVNKDCRDWLTKKRLELGEYFGIRLLVVGPEYEPGYKYQAEIIFPRVGITQAPTSVDNKRLKESVEITVLEDDVHGSVIVIVQNLQSSYLGS
jgi:hypothetical protein